MKNKSSSNHFATIASVFCLGLAYGLFISLAPVALINHRNLAHFLFEDDWAKFCFYVLAALVGGLSAIMVVTQRQDSEAEDSAKALTAAQRLTAHLKNHGFEVVATAVVFLFTACACLCQKLNIAGLPEASSLGIAWPNLGLTLIVIAMSCQFAGIRPKGHAKRPGWRWTLIEPVSPAWIILFAGISLLFSTWFPLLALPGIFIGMKWRLTSKIEEQTTISKPACEASEASL
ncbi:MAG: hypothetical protein C5B53_10490 [Candidatus Melainabacteria bacterium]|nr:MAG: hypothetical protein C5B53_10490 [Candidatus Melainabacteria bacterium]